MKIPSGFIVLLWCLIDHGVSGVEPDRMSVMEGDSVTLNTGVQTNQQDRIRWYYNNTRIAQINRDHSKTCTDVQCKDSDERFRGRLKLDHQTGSLTITHTRNITDAGVYQLLISSGSNESEKFFIVSVTGVSGADTEEVSVSVMDGDSVTLNTDVKADQQDRIRWYYNDIRIAEINRDQSKTCTDVQCNNGTKRFRDRLKLDHQTGSLTITNITNITDAGDYQLRISSGSSDSEKTFSVSVTGVSTADRDKMKRKTVKEGEPVTLVPGLRKNPNDLMTWYFNDFLIAEITGDQSKICEDVQCEERFRDRLNLDHQTGSLNITNTRNSDSGEYTLLINSGRFSILKTFSVTVTAVPDSGPSSAAVGGICAAAAVVLLLMILGVIYYLYRRSKKRKGNLRGNRTQHNNNQDTRVIEIPLNVTNGTSFHPPENPQTDAAKRTSINQTKTSQTGVAEENVTEETTLIHTGNPQEGVANGTSH